MAQEFPKVPVEGVAEMMNAAHWIVQILNAYRPRQTALEQHLAENQAIISPTGEKALLVAKGILDALETRLNAITNAIAVATEEAIRDVRIVCETPIILEGEAFAGILAEEAIPPITLKEVKPALEAMFSKIQIRRRPRYATS